jgi:succinate dehydrogenase / fumarate reductase cytochrome b subunit
MKFGESMAKRFRILFDLSSDLNPRNMRLGMCAWLIQRLSGLFLVFFVFMHITAIAQSNLGIIKGFEILDALRNPFWASGISALAFDLIAFGIIVFHAMNGIRIIFLDLGFGVHRYRLAFWISMLFAIAGSTFVVILGLPLLLRGG